MKQMKGDVVLVRASGIIKIRSIDWSYDAHCKLIKSDGLEVVRTDIIRKFLGDHIAMIVDDCGVLKDLEINEVATMLYTGVVPSVDSIHGDVFFCEIDEAGNDHPLTCADDVYDDLVFHFNDLLEV